MKRKVYYKSREAWLAGRRQGIGASEAATCLGLNPYETPYQLWRRKKGLDAPKAETFLMRAGHYLEEAVARFYADETGCHIIKSTTEDFTIMDTERPYLRVSPDRLFWHVGARRNEESKRVLECKTTQKSIDADNIPNTWYCQLQMNLGVGEYESGALAWLTMGRDFGYKNIDFDADFYQWMTERITEFWLKYIIGDEEPPAYTADDVMMKYPRHTEGKSVTATREVTDTLAELAAIKEAQKWNDTEVKRLEEDLKLFIGDAETLMAEDGQTILATWKAPKASEKFDEKAFKADNPELWAKYVTSRQGSRRFLLR